MTDHLDNDKNLKCGHKAVDWDGNGNCITCARDLVLGVDNDKEVRESELKEKVEAVEAMLNIFGVKSNIDGK